MFVSDRIVFLELHKTGCTHIRNLLLELVGGRLEGKHNQAAAALFTPGRIFLGSVRNPWDWYLSLWAYGCDGKGVVHGNTTRDGLRLRGRGWRTDPGAALRELLQAGRNRNAPRWRRTYRDVDDAGAFRDWLQMVHDPDTRADVGDGYGAAPMSSFAGLLTWRHTRLFCARSDEADALQAIASPGALEHRQRHHCFIDAFIRNEHLEHDLLEALDGAGIAVSAAVRRDLLQRPRTNTSSRTRDSGHYYDAASERLVGQRDGLLVGRFGYAPRTGPLVARAGAPVSSSSA